jgi:hypothetical protein
MKLEKERALEYFTDQFRKMMADNLDDFAENHAKYMAQDAPVITAGLLSAYIPAQPRLPPAAAAVASQITGTCSRLSSPRTRPCQVAGWPVNSHARIC